MTISQSPFFMFLISLTKTLKTENSGKTLVKFEGKQQSRLAGDLNSCTEGAGTGEMDGYTVCAWSKKPADWWEPASHWGEVSSESDCQDKHLGSLGGVQTGMWKERKREKFRTQEAGSLSSESASLCPEEGALEEQMFVRAQSLFPFSYYVLGYHISCYLLASCGL